MAPLGERWFAITSVEEHVTHLRMRSWRLGRRLGPADTQLRDGEGGTWGGGYLGLVRAQASVL